VDSVRAMLSLKYLCARSCSAARAWSWLSALLLISGAFGVLRRDVVVEVGGLDLTTMGEDAELVARIHRCQREQRRDYRVAFVAEPVCWTEVPHSRKVLARQRRRWSQGLAEVLWGPPPHDVQPPYGRIGLVTLPFPTTWPSSCSARWWRSRAWSWSL
jgi:cellulose synthase/poly-beta-1,6-N-acetylglucosamine synthase-like glycosyltransferase